MESWASRASILSHSHKFRPQASNNLPCLSGLLQIGRCERHVQRQRPTGSFTLLSTLRQNSSPCEQPVVRNASVDHDSPAMLLWWAPRLNSASETEPTAASGPATCPSRLPSSTAPAPQQTRCPGWSRSSVLCRHGLGTFPITMMGHREAPWKEAMQWPARQRAISLTPCSVQRGNICIRNRDTQHHWAVIQGRTSRIDRRCRGPREWWWSRGNCLRCSACICRKSSALAG